MKVVSWEAVEKKLTIEAKKFLKETYGLELTIPVKVNGRLKSTYGCFKYEDGVKKKPNAIEIGKNYILNQKWECVIDTLKHECIHYALFMMDKPFKDGHPVFENELRKHGVSPTYTGEYHGKIVLYGCPECGIVFDRVRKLPNNGVGYVCRHCEVQIEYLGERVI